MASTSASDATPSVAPGVSPSWRPPITLKQAGAPEVEWSKTFHVDDAQAFVTGLFGLYRDIFDHFLADAGRASAIGETTLYQVAEGPQLRFEIKKLGPNEFEVRGAHFATPGGVNICVGLNPHD